MRRRTRRGTTAARAIAHGSRHRFQQLGQGLPFERRRVLQIGFAALADKSRRTEPPAAA